MDKPKNKWKVRVVTARGKGDALAQRLEDAMNELADEGYLPSLVLGKGTILVIGQVDRSTEMAEQIKNLVVGKAVASSGEPELAGKHSKQVIHQTLEACANAGDNRRAEICADIAKNFASQVEAVELHKSIEDCGVVLEDHEEWADHPNENCPLSKTVRSLKEALEYQLKIAYS